MFGWCKFKCSHLTQVWYSQNLNQHSQKQLFPGRAASPSPSSLIFLAALRFLCAGLSRHWALSEWHSAEQRPWWQSVLHKSWQPRESSHRSVAPSLNSFLIVQFKTWHLIQLDAHPFHIIWSWSYDHHGTRENCPWRLYWTTSTIFLLASWLVKATSHVGNLNHLEILENSDNNNLHSALC